MQHHTESKLLESIQAARAKVQIGARYRHYKGHEYVARDLIIIEATNEVGVVYEAQEGARITFLRPLSSWLESVEHDGATKPRFARMEV